MSRLARRLLAVALLFSAGASLFGQEGARYLVVTHDNFYAAIQPLAQWKTKKGMLAKVVKTSEIGGTPAQIQTYIRNAWQTWPIRPEYVLIVGAPDFIHSSRLRTDDGYGDVTGNLLVDVPVGRFFCATAAECSTLVAKSLVYEKTPFASGDSNWLLRGTTIVNEDNPADRYYQPDCRYIRSLWNAAGFSVTESLMDNWGDNSSDVRAALNAGRGYLVYRGQCIANWWPPFDQVDPATLSNGQMLPVIVSGSCETMTLDTAETMLADVFVRAGTAQQPRGAVAYFGTTNAGASVSLQRSIVTKGFFTAAFTEGRYKAGDACVRGKFLLDSLAGGLHYLYEEWNLLGDPELPLWTALPVPLDVEFDSVIRPDSQQFSVRALRAMLPVSGARVCLMMDSTVYAAGLTDGQGRALLDICPAHDGELAVTVTARNCLPFEGAARVVAGPVRLDSLALCDSAPGGNGDGIAGPGETCSLIAELANVTDSLVPAVRAVLRSADGDVAVSESLATFGDIPGHGRAGNEAEPFVFTVIPEPADTLAEFGLRLWFGADSADLHFNLPLAPLVGTAEVWVLRQWSVSVAPNPIRGRAHISLVLPRQQSLDIAVRDVLGRRVRTILRGQLPAGQHRFEWDGSDDAGSRAPNGVYQLVCTGPGPATATKLLLAR